MITNKGIAVLNYVTDALVQKFPIIVTVCNSTALSLISSSNIYLDHCLYLEIVTQFLLL